MNKSVVGGKGACLFKEPKVGMGGRQALKYYLFCMRVSLSLIYVSKKKCVCLYARKNPRTAEHIFS
jgi:hypothetical protein